MAPEEVSCQDRVKYALQDVVVAAKAVKLELANASNESDGPSSLLRLTSIGGNARALALADAYEKLPVTGEDPGSLDGRIADVGKPFHRKNVHATGKMPELSKGSIPVSYTCVMPVTGNDIGYCKGLKFDKAGGQHFSASDSRDAACAAPSAVWHS